VRLDPGKTVTVTFQLRSDDLSFFGRNNTEIVEPGEFHVWIGGSSEAGLRAAFRLVAAEGPGASP
jgi:beta-glucosidase